MYTYVAVGIVLISLAVYLFCLFFVCFSTACFWRNKDAWGSPNSPNLACWLAAAGGGRIALCVIRAIAKACSTPPPRGTFLFRHLSSDYHLNVKLAIHRRRSGWNSGRRMASAEGKSVPSRVGYPTRGHGSVVSSPAGSGADNPGRKRILAYFEVHRTLLFVPIWQNLRLAICISVSYAKLWGDLSLRSPVIYAHVAYPNPKLILINNFGV